MITGDVECMRVDTADGEPLLQVSNLTVGFETVGRVVYGVSGLDFRVEQGETLAIVGESGSGKSVTAQAIMGILESPPAVVSPESSIRFRGRELLTLRAKDRRSLCGSEMAIVFQDALTALDGRFTVGYQLMEMFYIHGMNSREEAHRRVIELLDRVGIPLPERRLKEYPHQLSGGMQQRVMIAMAVARNPSLLIADEPTTALDVTIQAQVLDLLRELRQETNMALILITHDLGVVKETADRVIVMYGGRAMECGRREELFTRSAHPYTKALLRSIPSSVARDERLESIPGSPASPDAMPMGCVFSPRCSYAADLCREEAPPEYRMGSMHVSACHFAKDVGRD